MDATRAEDACLVWLVDYLANVVPAPEPDPGDDDAGEADRIRDELAWLGAQYAARPKGREAFVTAIADLTAQLDEIEAAQAKVDRRSSALVASWRSDPTTIRAKWSESLVREQHVLAVAVFEAITVAPTVRGKRFDPQRLVPVWRA